MSKKTAKRKLLSASYVAWTSVATTVLLVVVIICCVIVPKSIKSGVEAATKSYKETMPKVIDETYQKFYDEGFKQAEAKHHTHNEISVAINSVTEAKNLEVLQVSDVVYVITDKSENKEKTESWLKVSGTGIYTVNLRAAEYLVDDSRHYVLVRVPSPTLDADHISLDKFDSLHFSENKWNPTNSIKTGEELFIRQQKEAKLLMQEDFNASQDYSEFAKSSAKSMITSLIKSLNPEIDDLKVEVEFYESGNM